MSTLFEKPLKITHLMTTSVERAKAIDDPVRAAMLDLLSRKPMSVEEISTKLKAMKIGKAPTTVRHHLGVLKQTGLVELVKIEEARGGVLKYYASKARFLGYEAPPDFDEKFGSAIEDVSQGIVNITRDVIEKYGDLVRGVAQDLKPCPYCSTQHFAEFVLLEILHRATAKATLGEEFAHQLGKLEGRSE
ncbi:MAG: ArsR/SmtB family transcription factor [Candidatus Geothermarchaeales archaeon]